jgi:glycine/D-amino acid oxidase-like deaminating enzyme
MTPLRSALRDGKPVWMPARSARAQPRYSSLRNHRHADIVVVGGGIIGALISCTLAEAGVRVAVLEAGFVGYGSTVASSALLLQEPDLGMAQLARRYGRAASQRIWQLGHDAVREFIRTVRQHHIDCDLVERDTLYCATTADALARLRHDRHLRSQAGFGGEWLSAETLLETTGVRGLGAIRTTGNAQLDPFKACTGLMQSAAAAGATVFERSPVTRIAPVRSGVRVHTKTGRIDASRVVIATGYATKQFRALAGRFRMYHTYVLATAALGAAQRRSLGFGNVMVWDTEKPYHYARWTSDHRLLLGGGDQRVRTGIRRAALFDIATRQLRADFELLVPTLAGVGIEQAWEGVFALTPDSLPYIGAHRRYPGHLFALGYGGNGMSYSTLAARFVLEEWRGTRSPDQALFRFGRVR